VNRTITVTGGSGFVGQLLCRGLARQGFRIQVFDQVRGPLLNVMRRRYFGTTTTPAARRAARAIRAAQARGEPALRRAGVIRQGTDDILADRDVIAQRFAGSAGVIHLAGIPHPHWPGATDEDFIRVNYDASVNVFEAARDARVPVFVFASSAQVYKINAPVRLEQLPVLESNYLPLPMEGQTTYGFLKAAFERYLQGRCTSGPTQAVALRLEYPGFRSTVAANLYISTSIENLVAGFSCALRPPDGLGFEPFNIADAEVEESIVDIQAYVRSRWPYVTNHTVGNQSLLSTEKARRVLGYRPVTGGRYIDPALVR
jgi:nucleoside-diphosphate-sugar epimerase